MNDPQLTRRAFLGSLGLLALPVVAAGAPAEAELNLLVMGDWGAPPRTNAPGDAKTLNDTQNRVAAAMGAYTASLTAAGSKLDAVLPVGDNFYADLKGDGLKNENDPRLIQRFEKLYPKAAMDAPFLFALGNHDYEDDDGKGWKHQIAYARRAVGGEVTGRWKFPAEGNATWYRQDFPMGDKSLSILVLDTNTDHVDARWDGQITWLEKQLKETETFRWRIVVAHHPMFTDGYHWDGAKDPSLYPKIRKTILPKLKNVVFYVSGHDHNQQHIHHTAYPTLDFLLSGSGGGDFIKKRKRFHPPYKNEFMEDYGFLHLRFTGNEAKAHFIAVAKDGSSKVRHTVTRA